MTILGRWLKARMREVNVTGTEIAHVVGKSGTTVSHWVSGKKVPTANDCVKLALFFGEDWQRVLVTAGVIDGSLVGVDPLPVPQTRREAFMQHLERDVPGLSAASRELIMEKYDRVIGNNKGGEV